MFKFSRIFTLSKFSRSWVPKYSDNNNDDDDDDDDDDIK